MDDEDEDNGLYEEDHESDWEGPEWESDDVEAEDEQDEQDERVWVADRQERQLRRRRRLSRFPELKVETTVDGRLRVARNVVLDTDDANEDGLQTMRVGLALVEFPSVVELYTEHQECSLAVLKLEEDEEVSDGFPFFMSESGDDDALIVTNYYNQVTLKVFDDGVRDPTAVECVGV